MEEIGLMQEHSQGKINCQGRERNGSANKYLFAKQTQLKFLTRIWEEEKLANRWKYQIEGASTLLQQQWGIFLTHTLPSNNNLLFALLTSLHFGLSSCKEKLSHTGSSTGGLDILYGSVTDIIQRGKSFICLPHSTTRSHCSPAPPPPQRMCTYGWQVQRSKFPSR